MSSENTITLSRAVYVYEELEIPRDQISDGFIASYEGGGLTNVIEDLAKDMGTTPEEIDNRRGWTETSRSVVEDDYEIQTE
ncbi:hypothetical protein [Streptomyces sp. BH104]|uniref:hypothetical protein n=1 Tax=unclassified Streptomyces TaxID=2593676 RepID=UPI003BB5CD31